MNLRNFWLGCVIIGGTVMMTVPSAHAATDNDKNFLASASQSDVNEIALSKAAEAKAASSEVKAFAEKMIAEHTLTESMKPFAESRGLTPPAGPDADHQDELTNSTDYRAKTSTKNISVRW
jgi:putative membrane protein